MAVYLKQKVASQKQGLVFDGVCGAIAMHFDIMLGNTTPAFVGVTTTASMTLVVGMVFSYISGGFIANTGVLFEFSASATYPTGTAPSSISSVDVSHSSVPIGSLVVDESVGNLTTQSLETFFKDCVGVRDSDRLGGATFRSALPIVAFHAVGNNFEVFPHQQGGVSLAPILAEERFSLVNAVTGLPLGPLDNQLDGGGFGSFCLRERHNHSRLPAI